ncbi:MAG TPA: pyrimidine dimer DNA glycosylase/endonuclease V [Pyrinomonadaceae bacterium]|nr:pyrimidine dimer DNA glycosylase/endonuclease V [Pyrinomonadaceae bacterium]
MRLWTVHPKYLDARGLVALWRETLLAQKVLQGNTKGYRNHPQLIRFKEQINPVGAVATYLRAIHQEAARRGYNFDSTKIAADQSRRRMKCSRGQLLFEWEHLQRKLELRDPQRHAQIKQFGCPEPHPLFTIVEGDVEAWER